MKMNFMKRENANMIFMILGGSSDGSSTIKATPAMLRCSKIMQLQREIHPTILLSLEGIVDQVCSL